MTRVIALSGLLVHLVGCSPKCGDGTHEVNGACVPVSHIDSGPPADTAGSVSAYDSEGSGDSKSSGPYVQVTAASTYTCGLHQSGEARCWGLPILDTGQTLPPDDVTFQAISAGYYHACGLTTSGATVCWGTPLVDFGQTAANEDVEFTALAVSDFATCGITTGGSASCWGDDSYLQITDVPTGSELLAMDARGSHICGIDGLGQAVCWGDTGGHEPPAEDAGYASIAAGSTQFGCATTSLGEVLCWGDDEAGEADIAPADQADFDGQFFSQVDAGAFHTCALATGGAVYCWGNNNATQTEPPPGYSFVQISVGLYHSCGVTDTGDIICWGENQLGQCDVP